MSTKAYNSGCMQVHAKPKAAPEQIQYIVDWIAGSYPNGESGIVYCLTRKDTEQVAAELAQHGLACGCYHADMDPVQRESVHMQWSSGAASVLQEQSLSDCQVRSLMQVLCLARFTKGSFLAAASW